MVSEGKLVEIVVRASITFSKAATVSSTKSVHFVNAVSFNRAREKFPNPTILLIAFKLKGNSVRDHKSNLWEQKSVGSLMRV